MYDAVGVMVFEPEWQRPGDVGSCAIEGPRDASALRSRRRQSAPGDRRAIAGLPKRCRMRKRRDFLRVQGRRGGKRSPHFVVILAPAPGPACRLGVTVSKRIGRAVQRNRVKRHVREFFRLHREELQPAHDLLIIARAGADRLSFRDVEAELAAVLAINAG